jgi:hypothetical protein
VPTLVGAGTTKVVTTIKFVVPTLVGAGTTKVVTTIKVYDVLGREIATLVNEEKEPGSYTATFDTRHLSLASGVYLYRLQAGRFVDVKKMLYVR